MTLTCQIYLAVLSTYHVLSGGLSFFFGNAAMRFYKSFYGTDPIERRHLMLILKPWGALSIAIGIAGWSAVGQPSAHRGTVLAILVLLVLRIVYRVRCRAELQAISRVPLRKNVINLLLLAGGVLILGAWLAAEGGVW
jgi:hypothetical protein